MKQRDFTDTLQERFELFHAEHADIYDLFKRFTLEMARSGRSRYGAKSLMERVRWHHATTSGGGDFKINNNFTSRYVRLLLQERPDLAGFFETRRLKA
jgi:hypothetical protein